MTTLFSVKIKYNNNIYCDYEVLVANMKFIYLFKKNWSNNLVGSVEKKDNFNNRIDCN